MTRQSWLERLTPFTGGAAIALLVVAMVVQPAWAVTPACAACMDYWNAHAADPGQPCYGMTGYARQQCISDKVSQECAAPRPDGSTPPCNTPPGDPGYTNCASEHCSLSIQCAYMTTTSCTGFCNGCDSTGNNCNELMITPIDPRELISACKVYCGCGTATTP